MYALHTYTVALNLSDGLTAVYKFSDLSTVTEVTVNAHKLLIYIIKKKTFIDLISFLRC